MEPCISVLQSVTVHLPAICLFVLGIHGIRRQQEGHPAASLRNLYSIYADGHYCPRTNCRPKCSLWHWKASILLVSKWVYNVMMHGCGRDQFQCQLSFRAPDKPIPKLGLGSDAQCISNFRFSCFTDLGSVHLPFLYSCVSFLGVMLMLSEYIMQN